MFEPNRGQLLDGSDFLVAAGAGTFQLSLTGMRWDRRIPCSLAPRTDETPFGLRFVGGTTAVRFGGGSRRSGSGNRACTKTWSAAGGRLRPVTGL